MALARAAGYPVPLVFDVRPDALVLERVEGPTMAGSLARRPWLARRHMTTLARLHDRLHSIPLNGASLLHLDLHPENVLMSPSGPVVIDWTNARPGASETDVALTWLIMRTSAGLPGRMLASLFARRVGLAQVRRGIAAAASFRLADPHVTDAERSHVLAVIGHR